MPSFFSMNTFVLTKYIEGNISKFSFGFMFGANDTLKQSIVARQNVKSMKSRITLA